MAGDYRQRPLDARDRARNRAIGAIRAPVERTFALLKRWYGYARVRYRSLVNNTLQLQLLAVTLNLRRTLVLTPLRADSAQTRAAAALMLPTPHFPPLASRHLPVPTRQRNELRHSSKLSHGCPLLLF